MSAIEQEQGRELYQLYCRTFTPAQRDCIQQHVVKDGWTMARALEHEGLKWARIPLVDWSLLEGFLRKP